MPKPSDHVTKKDGPTETHSPNVLPAPEPSTQTLTSFNPTVRFTSMCTHPTSNHHLSTADLTAIRQTHQHTARLNTHLSQDLLTQTDHPKCLHFIHNMYTLRELKQVSSTQKWQLWSFWEFLSLSYILHSPAART
jgi:hypothetical protein